MKNFHLVMRVCVDVRVEKFRVQGDIAKDARMMQMNDADACRLLEREWL